MPFWLYVGGVAVSGFVAVVERALGVEEDSHVVVGVVALSGQLGWGSEAPTRVESPSSNRTFRETDYR